MMKSIDLGDTLVDDIDNTNDELEDDIDNKSDQLRVDMYITSNTYVEETTIQLGAGGGGRGLEQSKLNIHNAQSITSIYIKSTRRFPLKKNRTKHKVHMFYSLTLLVMLGNYEPTCIVTIKLVTM